MPITALALEEIETLKGRIQVYSQCRVFAFDPVLASEPYYELYTYAPVLIQEELTMNFGIVSRAMNALFHCMKASSVFGVRIENWRTT